MEDILTEYLNYTSNTEVPVFFNRWCLLSGIGAFLGRQFYFPFAHTDINTNMYCMLIGSAGSKKSTAIKTMRKILTEAGYNTIAADKTSKEKFLVDLEGSELEGVQSPDAFLNHSMFGANDEPKEMFIMADEFNDFIGINNLEFISLLGNLWDFSGPFKYRIKTGKSLNISDPTISILGGNTPTNFARAFPSDIFGQGFFSRLILIYGEPNGKSIPFPEPRDARYTAEIVSRFHSVKHRVRGIANFPASTRSLLEKIYRSSRFTVDPRFDAYYNRRHTHLIKLCLILCAIGNDTEVSERTAIRANTVLRYTEQLMPKALGEFGKSKNSEIAHRVVQALESSFLPMKFKDLWKIVSTELNNMQELNTILMNLVQADKIIPLGDGRWLPKKEVMDQSGDSSLYDWAYLTDEELKMVQ